MSSNDPTIALDPIPGFPGYLACRLGVVFSMRNRKRTLNGKPIPMKGTSHERGYIRIGMRLDGKLILRFVHNVILETYIGPCPDGMECLHGDGNPGNNSLDNLRWGTHEANESDKARHGTTYKCSKHHNAKMNESKAAEALIMYNSGINMTCISRHFGVGRNAIRSIINGVTWKNAR